MNPESDLHLMVAVPYEVILQALRELDPADRHEWAAAESLLDCLPQVMLARVEKPRAGAHRDRM